MLFFKACKKLWVSISEPFSNMKWKSTQNYNETVSSFKILYLFLRYHISKEQFECVRSDVPVLLHFTKKKCGALGKLCLPSLCTFNFMISPAPKWTFLQQIASWFSKQQQKKTVFPVGVIRSYIYIILYWPRTQYKVPGQGSRRSVRV